jgi:hypothetical protein
MCKGNEDEKCFTSSNDKHCDHNATTIKLDEVGDYLVFPSRFYHRGYYKITSNKTYYTAQLFCKATESFKMWQNVTRKVNQDMIPGRIIELRLTTFTQDIRDNWDTTYSVNVLPPEKAFDGEKIDATKNRHIPSGMFLGVPLIAELVKYFEDKYTHLKVCSVWIIKNSRENGGFQRWHRDFYLGTEVTTTIVLNIGAVTNT